MTLPNFLVVGAAKCGTTSLHEYLNQHPEVFIPEKKECRFFSNLSHFNGPGHDQELNATSTRSLAEYQALSAPVREQRAIGDISHDYLYYHDESIRNIKQHLDGDVRIVMVLRDPRERAYSHYMHHVKVGISPDRSFEKALAEEQARIATGWSWNWHYTRAGFYHDQVQAYLGAFDPTRVRIYLYEELVKDTPGLMRDLFEFLEVPADFQVESEVHNQSTNVRSRGLSNFLRQESSVKERLRGMLSTVGLSDATIHNLKQRFLTLNATGKIPMKPETRERLTAFFAEDIQRLEDLIHRDLSRWRR